MLFAITPLKIIVFPTSRIDLGSNNYLDFSIIFRCRIHKKFEDLYFKQRNGLSRTLVRHIEKTP